MPNQQTNDSDLRTVLEVAATLRTSKYTVWRYIKEGRLPAFLIGGQYRIAAADLRRFIDANSTLAGGAR